MEIETQAKKLIKNLIKAEKSKNVSKEQDDKLCVEISDLSARISPEKAAWVPPIDGGKIYPVEFYRGAEQVFKILLLEDFAKKSPENSSLVLTLTQAYCYTKLDALDEEQSMLWEIFKAGRPDMANYIQTLLGEGQSVDYYRGSATAASGSNKFAHALESDKAIAQTVTFKEFIGLAMSYCIKKRHDLEPQAKQTLFDKFKKYLNREARAEGR